MKQHSSALPGSSRRLLEVELPALQAEKQHAQTALESVQAELARTRLDRAAEHALPLQQYAPGPLQCTAQCLPTSNVPWSSRIVINSLGT